MARMKDLLMLRNWVLLASVLLPLGATAQTSSLGGGSLTGHSAGGGGGVDATARSSAASALSTANTALSNANGAATSATTANGAATAAGTAAAAANTARAKTYSPMSYGAVFDGASHPLSAISACSSPTACAAANSQWAWMTNPEYGLTFTMTTSAAAASGATSLVFTVSLTTNTAGIAGAGSGVWAVSQFNGDPGHNEKSLAVGFLVTDGTSNGYLATNTTVSAFNPATGTVTLSAGTAKAVPSGAVLTFTTAPAAMQVLQQDYLGIQSAVSAASDGNGRGTVRLPGGVITINHMVVNPGVTGPNTGYSGNVNIKGDGQLSTSINFSGDAGARSCALGAGNASVSAIGRAEYSGFSIYGAGAPATAMDGLCIARGDQVDHVTVRGFHAGIALWGDHNTIKDFDLGQNTYGVWFAPYTYNSGNQVIRDGGLGSEAIAGIEVDCTNTMDFTDLRNLDLGTQSPYSIHRGACRSADGPQVFSFLTNSIAEELFCEQIGEGFIYGANQGDSIQANTFIHVAPWMNASNYKLAGTTPQAVIYTAGVFTQNNFVNTDLTGQNGNNINIVTDALVEGTNSIAQNDYGYQQTFAGTQAPAKPFQKSNNAQYNRFTWASGSGTLRINLAGGVAAGQVMAYENSTLHYLSNGNTAQVMPTSGGIPFGVALNNGNQYDYVMVAETGFAPVKKDAVTPTQGSLLVASATTAGNVTTATTNPTGLVVGVMQDTNASASGNATVLIALRPAVK